LPINTVTSPVKLEQRILPWRRVQQQLAERRWAKYEPWREV